MTNSKNITVTDGRLISNLEKLGEHVYNKQGVSEQIIKSVEENQLRTGVITKFYHYLDKAEVQLDNSNSRVVCKILHRFGGAMIDFFTPSSDSTSYCDSMKEPCLIPRVPLHVVVAKLHDADSKEDLILGFYLNEDVVGLNPAKPGNFKISSVGGTNEFWIKFGSDGLDIRLPSASTMNVGERDRNMETVEYAQLKNVYTKSEIDALIGNTFNANNYYSKEDVDELLQEYEERIQELEHIVENMS